MNTTMTQFDSINSEKLADIEGGIAEWVVIGGVVLYGIVAEYTDEKCIMDKGKHWYCTKLN